MQDSDIYGGGNGESPDKAFVIEVSNSLDGIQAEYDYLKKKFGQEGVDWKCTSQMLTSYNDKDMDVLSIEFKDHSKRQFWFDISKFYGK
jgi:hypothetical protein